MILRKPASQWCPKQLEAFLRCHHPNCLDPIISPLCSRMVAYQRCGRLANYHLHLELASHCAPTVHRVFAVPYIEAMTHPHLRAAVEQSGWVMAEHLHEYSDPEGSSGYRTPDSDEDNPHPKRKLKGKVHHLAMQGSKRRRTE